MSSTLDLLADQIAEDVAHLDAAHHRVLSKLRLFDEGGGWYKQGFRSCAQWLSWRVGWTLNTAREHVRVANALASLPQIDRALERGELSYCKVRALTRVATPTNEATLLEQAKLTTGQQLETICRKYASVAKHDDTTPHDDAARRYITRRDTEDGMVIIEASLHPEEAALVWSALERLAAERCRDSSPAANSPAANSPAANSPAANSPAANSPAANSPAANSTAASSPVANSPVTSAVDAAAESSALVVPEKVSAETSPPLPSARTARSRPAFDRADALVHIAQQVVRGDTPDRSPTEIAITIPIESLQTTNHRESNADPTEVACCADGTAISAHAARRLACDAGLLAFIEDADGNVLAAGHKRRTISGSMKRALLRRDGTCRFPGCRARAFLEGHHLQHWVDGGATKLDNLLSLCGYHHRFVHEYGFTIERRADNTVVAYDAHGRMVPELAPATFSRDTQELGWPNIERRNAHLGISADTIETWDGNRIDYGLCVDAILSADDRKPSRWM